MPKKTPYIDPIQDDLLKNGTIEKLAIEIPVIKENDIYEYISEDTIKLNNAEYKGILIRYQETKFFKSSETRSDDYNLTYATYTKGIIYYKDLGIIVPEKSLGSLRITDPTSGRYAVFDNIPVLLQLSPGPSAKEPKITAFIYTGSPDNKLLAADKGFSGPLIKLDPNYANKMSYLLYNSTTEEDIKRAAEYVEKLSGSIIEEPKNDDTYIDLGTTSNEAYMRNQLKNWGITTELTGQALIDLYETERQKRIIFPAEDRRNLKNSDKEQIRQLKPNGLMIPPDLERQRSRLPETGFQRYGRMILLGVFGTAATLMYLKYKRPELYRSTDRD